MGLTTQNTGAISFKKVSGKAHTQQNFAVTEEGISTNIQLSYSTVFGQPIESKPVTNSGLTTLYSTNEIVQRIKFPIDIIPNTQIGVNQSQGYRLKLPADWNTHPGALYPKFTTGTYLHTALGKLQIVPSLYGFLKPDGTTEYDPILYQTDGSTVIAKFDPINWYFDPYSGILFVEDPSAGYDVSAARPGFIEAFLYVGKYLDQVVTGITSGSTGSTNFTANNGLTKVGSNVRLGGTLTGNTTIDLSGNTLSLNTINGGIFNWDKTGLALQTATGGTITLSTYDPTINSSAGISFSPSLFYINLSDHSSENGATIIAQSDGFTTTLSLGAVDNVGSLQTSIQLGTGLNSFLISDNRTGTTQTGIEYVADYSANYTNRSLVDRGWVLTQIPTGTSVITKINGTSIASTGIGAGVGTTGVDGVFLGVNAGNNVSQQKMVAIGYFAGDGATGAYNSNFIGVNAGQNATSADKSNFIGHHAGDGATNSLRSNFIGRYAGAGATNAPYSNFLGAQAGWNALNATQSTFIGMDAGDGATNAAHSIFIGTQAGNNDTVDNTTTSTDASILIGNSTSTNGFKNSIAIGTSGQNSMVNQFLVAPSYVNWQIAGLDYVMPTIQAVGQLTNDGAGNLSWSGSTLFPINGLSKVGPAIRLGGTMTGTSVLDSTIGGTAFNDTYVVGIVGAPSAIATYPASDGHYYLGGELVVTSAGNNRTAIVAYPQNNATGLLLTNETAAGYTGNLGVVVHGNNGNPMTESFSQPLYIIKKIFGARSIYDHTGANLQLDIAGTSVTGLTSGSYITMTKGNASQFEFTPAGEFKISGSTGTYGQVLKSGGAGGSMFWGTGGSSGSTVTASNGLHVSGSDVRLGGSLTADTTIAMSTHQFVITGGTVSLPKVRIGLGTGGGIVTNNSNNDILVRNSATGDIEIRDAVTLISGMTSGGSQNIYITKKIVTGSTTLLTTDFVVFINGVAPLTLTLPLAPNDGEVLKFKDVSGNASTNNITINGNGKNIDGSSTILINSDRGAVELCFDSTLNFWSVMNFVG